MKESFLEFSQNSLQTSCFDPRLKTSKTDCIPLNLVALPLRFKSEVINLGWVVA